MICHYLSGNVWELKNHTWFQAGSEQWILGWESGCCLPWFMGFSWSFFYGNTEEYYLFVYQVALRGEMAFIWSYWEPTIVQTAESRSIAQLITWQQLGLSKLADLGSDTWSQHIFVYTYITGIFRHKPFVQYEQHPLLNNLFRHSSSMVV